jgi:serine/threonine protein kinase
MAGVYQLHKRQMSHRDLKPENVCLDEDFNLKIIDFGFAASIYEERGIEGTPAFFSPGQHAGARTNFHKDDIFTCGIILYCMLHRAQPFAQATKKEENYKPLYLGLHNKFWES